MALQAVREGGGGSGAPTPGKPVSPRSFNTKDIVVLVCAVGSSLGLTWLLFTQILPLQGSQGFLIIWFAAFLVIYYAAVREMDGKMMARDRLMGSIVSV